MGVSPPSGPRPASPSVPGAKPSVPVPGAKPAVSVPGANPSGGNDPLSQMSGMPPIDQLKGRQLGRVLQKMGKVTREQYQEALNFQKEKGGVLGRILIDLGYIKDGDLNIALAAQKGYEWFNVEGFKPDPKVISAVPAQLAMNHKVLPVQYEPGAQEARGGDGQP